MNWLICDFDPRAPIRRWSYIKKLALMIEIDAGRITRAEVTRLHGISEDELTEWYARRDQYGSQAMKITKQPWRDKAHA